MFMQLSRSGVVVPSRNVACPQTGQERGKRKLRILYGGSPVQYIPYLAKVAARLNPSNIQNPC
jgi:hypothetical protein